MTKQQPPDNETWVPRPGMVKRLCLGCGHYYASPHSTTSCANCLATRPRPSDGGLHDSQIPARAKNRGKGG